MEKGVTEKVVILDDIFTVNQLHFFKCQLLNSYKGEATDKPFVSVYQNSVNSGWFKGVSRRIHKRSF